jgi:hypothetical protein
VCIFSGTKGSIATFLNLQVVTQRLLKLQTKGTPSHMPAWVHLKRRKKNKAGQLFWEVVHAKGHLDEVQALSKPVGVPLPHTQPELQG